MARHFSDPVKDLIDKMLQVDPEKRIDMEGIIAHKWFAEGFDKSKVEAFRGCSQVKPSTQQVNQWAADAKESGAKEKHESKEATGLNAFQIIGALTQGTLHALTVQQQGVAIKRSTRFITGLDAETTSDAIMKVLSENKANPKKKDPTRQEIKGFVTANKGMLTYAVQIQPTISPKLTLVEMRRTRGDTFEYHELYRQLMTTLREQV